MVYLFLIQYTALDDQRGLIHDYKWCNRQFRAPEKVNTRAALRVLSCRDHWDLQSVC